MTIHNDQTERDLFIAWYSDTYGYVPKRHGPTGDFSEPEPAKHWKTWFAARSLAPHGYMLVPVEPTREMIRAGWKQHPSTWGYVLVPPIYKAMIEASPLWSPPQVAKKRNGR